MGTKVHGLSWENRCSLMPRSIETLLNFRNTGWPWPQCLADCQDRLQRRFLSQLIRIEQLPGKQLQSYHRRRMRTIANMVQRRGSWSQLPAKRVVLCADHLQRPRNHASLASMFYLWHDASWLRMRRLSLEIGGPGRPGTRLVRGPVIARWDESMVLARSKLHI